MQQHRIADLFAGRAHVGDTVTVEGWVRTRRDSKAGLSFVQITDGSCFDSLQVVAREDLGNYTSDVLQASAGASVRVTGTLEASQGKGQTVELQASAFELVGGVDDPATYPMAPKRHTMEHLRANAHLRPRTNLIGAVARVRNTLSYAVHRFFQEQGFHWIHTPIITANDAEGAGEMFQVSTLDQANLPRTPAGDIDYGQDFFGRKAHLTVSGQLNVETYCLALSKVYTFGPTFRAENSNTRRHLAEFWMIEPEIAFANLDDNIALAEAFLKSIFRAVLDERADDLTFFDKFIHRGVRARLEHFVDATFEEMTYTEAIHHIEAADRDWEYAVQWGSDLQSEHERYLSEEVVGRPVVVRDYPKEIKAFYMRLNDDGATVAAMDVLAPGIGEIIGGSQREERLDVLDRRIVEVGLNVEDYWWYRDLRRYGTVPHAGFGLGFERAIMYATGIDNIREVIPFPRSPRSADF